MILTTVKIPPIQQPGVKIWKSDSRGNQYLRKNISESVYLMFAKASYTRYSISNGILGAVSSNLLLGRLHNRIRI